MCEQDENERVVSLSLSNPSHIRLEKRESDMKTINKDDTCRRDRLHKLVPPALLYEGHILRFPLVIQKKRRALPEN